MDKFRMALVISVMLNLFLAGALVSGYVSLSTNTRVINAGSLRFAGSGLPVAVSKPFRAALRETRRSMRPTILQARAAKAQAAALLRQPVVDQAAVISALDRARLADMTIRAAVERRAVSYLAAVPLADRATLADAMQRRVAKAPPAAE